MNRMLARRSSLGVVVCLVGCASPALGQLATRPELRAANRLAAASQAQAAVPGQTELHGTVLDERGAPLAGAVVSALGATSVFALSDADGRFVFRNLMPGPYLVRAHLQGYRSARGRMTQVAVTGRTLSTLVLTRRADADQPPAVLAAGVGPADIQSRPAPDAHDHDEVAWRMRHGKRSVLKEAEDVAAALGQEGTPVERSRGAFARLATSMFNDLSLNGQINLLTTASFDRPQDLFTVNGGAPRGVAYVSLAAPGAQGDWTMRGTITQGDLSSWILAGAYARRAPAVHAYEAGVSYSMQRYLGGNAEALAAMRDGSRNVGSMHAYDTWTLHPRFAVSYGGEYSRYDYLADRGLFSPRATVTLRPSPDDNLTLRATVAHRETAPGAAEFLTPEAGLWLPPERTFSHVTRGAFRPERMDHLEVSAERTFPGDVRVGARAFRQIVDDQLVTVFGMASDDGPAPVGHYQVGSAGDVEARGWGVSVRRDVTDSVRATIDYAQIQAGWTGMAAEAEAEAFGLLAASVRRTSERIHDLTASVESVVAPTATRLFVLYKMNTAYAAPEANALTPASGARFNVQVNQALPFLKFMSAEWEMLVAVSDLFHRELSDGSVYDELLVVRPPKRMLGGVTVKF